MELPSTRRCGTYNLSEEQRIGPQHQRTIEGFVRKVRRDILDEVLGIQHTTGPKACMQKVAEHKCLYKLLAKHNDPRSTQVVKYDDVICLRSQFDNGLSLASMLCNVFCQINSGWPVTLDGGWHIQFVRSQALRSDRQRECTSKQKLLGAYGLHVGRRELELFSAL